ncbi:MAG: aspartate--tRNA(Asn) ligase [Bacteroidetes bacterium]|nr:aspartate--tRNA(Asn) ligase [Bacteroidota bacterium]
MNNQSAEEAPAATTLRGWVEHVRIMKKVQFFVLRMPDDTLLQCTNLDQTLAETMAALTPETAVAVTGTIQHNEGVKLNGRELIVESIEILNTSEPLPIQDNANPDARYHWRFLDLRSQRNHLIFKVQTLIEHSMREYWNNNGFIEIHSPKLMGVPSESRAELFATDYFGQPAYLAQSPQYYKQYAISSGFNRVFEIGPVFRADPSATVRHTAEFTSVDVEIAWIDSHEDVMKFEEEWLAYVLGKVAAQYGDEIRETFGVEVVVPTVPFPRIPIAQAYEIVHSMGHEIERHGDLDAQAESKLGEYVKEKFGHEFLFVTDYPINVRPFYHMRDGNTTRSFDLLWKGMEITTGAQREHRYDVLAAQAVEKGITLGHIEFYTECFKFGCPPHGGLGLGLSRVVMLLLNLPNIREATFISRTKNRLVP